MNKAPAFQFYAAEWLADESVQLMTLEEEGAYIRLLSICWREGSIPADESKLSKLCKGGSTTVIRVVAACFNQHPEDASRLVHKRLELEREKQAEWRRKSSEGGKASGKSRGANSLSLVPARDSASVKGGSRVVQLPNEGWCNTSSLSLSLSSKEQLQEQKTTGEKTEAQLLADAWNNNRGSKLPAVLKITPDRSTAAKKYLGAGGSVEEFTEAVQIAARTPFTRGENNTRWKLGFDDLIEREDIRTKVLEGRYGVPDPLPTLYVTGDPSIELADLLGSAGISLQDGLTMPEERASA